MKEAYIFDSVRTPRGKGRESGSLHTTSPMALFSGVLTAVADRSNLNSKEIEDVICGCVTQVGEQGGCIARFAALKAGYDEKVPGVTVNRFCGSGLEAIRVAAMSISSGAQDLVVAGGVESMSRVKMGSDGGALWDASFQCAHPMVPQGISADLLATLYGFSRNELDEFAFNSHQRAFSAQQNGYFKKSIVPVKDINGDTLLDHDENIRADTTIAKLSGLNSAFSMLGTAFALDAMTKNRYPEIEAINHFHTAGNSSAIVDGAAAVLLGDKAKGKALGLTPRAKIKWIGVIASEPVAMLKGPVPVTRLALQKTGMKISDIDLFEVNEAFAAVPLLYMQEFNLSPDKINVHGGAIAMGHPLGATGSILTGTLLDALEQKNLNTGLVTLCIGGGMGICAILERV
ncbi:MAG: acetyl-CoA C-acetyltransferase [bacterium]|nr:acetyl-CoA C-acetyltransferase [bacterium]